MSAPEKISEAIREAIERDGMLRILAPRDKELMARHNVSRTTLNRILRDARARLSRSGLLKQKSQITEEE